MKQSQIKSYTIGEICELYPIGGRPMSRHVFYSWLEKIKEKVGPLIGKTYTPAQVKIMFDHWGAPDTPDTE